MLFSSLIFLFFFLPIVLTAYICVRPSGRNALLLAASLLFYFWGEQAGVVLMLASICFNYLFGLFFALPTLQYSRNKKIIFISAIFFNIGLLAYFKYSFFFIENINILLDTIGCHPLPVNSVHLPIGISFFTFQAISYVVDVYRRDAEVQKNPFHLGLYIALFPQLIAGPIVRYNDISNEIKNRSVTLQDFSCGIERFVFGLGKKVLIANPAGQMADEIFKLSAQDISIGTAWLGILCYTLQIYFDFSGYSDMAIGLGRMFGFHFLENFNYPYISKSIREFWRRWHISLSTWFRDYLYIPLGGNQRSNQRTNLNLLIVFLLCGLWHGASWNFVLWGLLHGFFLVVERGYFGKKLGQFNSIWQHCYTLFVIANSWVVFRIERLTDAEAYFSAMYGFSKADKMLPQISMKLDSKLYFMIATGMILSLPVYPWLQQQWKMRLAVGEFPVFHAALKTAKLVLVFGILLYSAASLAAGSYNPFIYFRF